MTTEKNKTVTNIPKQAVDSLLFTPHDTQKTLGADVCVARAVIANGPNLLLIKRAADDTFGGKWEFAGGCVEQGETVLEALHREVLEETGLKIEAITSHLGSFEYLSKLGTGKLIKEFVFLVRPIQDHITLTEHDEFAWTTHDSVLTYQTTEVTESVIQMLAQSK